MSKKNSKARRALEKIYGEGCFMERAGIRKIKGTKKNAHQMTYHHLKHRSEGGAATVENGANLALENHEFLHSLSREEEEEINNQLRNWKMNMMIVQGSGRISNYSSINFSDLTKDENCIIIKVENTTKEQFDKLQNNKRQKFNRSKVKRETQKFIEEELYGEEYEL